VCVAGGSNVDPERHILLAAGELVREFPGMRFSRCYRNAAVGFEGPDFINFACVFDTALAVDAVIARLQRIEELCGRQRHAPKWAPRSMDLDILLYDDLVTETPTLKLPRPDLVKRAYMLGPLAEIAPDVVHPTAGATIGELWARFDRAAHAMHAVPPDLAALTSPRSGPRPPPAPGR